jgi:hypothetical protein
MDTNIGRDCMTAFGPTRPTGCKLLLIGCLHRLLGLSPHMQENFSFLPGLSGTSTLAAWELGWEGSGAEQCVKHANQSISLHILATCKRATNHYPLACVEPGWQGTGSRVQARLCSDKNQSRPLLILLDNNLSKFWPGHYMFTVTMTWKSLLTF